MKCHRSVMRARVLAVSAVSTSVLLFLSSLVVSCFPEDREEPFDLPVPPLQGDPTLPECGYNLAPPASDGALQNPCTEGTAIFSEVVENEWVYEDPTEVHTFSLPTPGRVCIKVLNGDADGNHRVWWGKVLVDGDRIIGSSRLHSSAFEVSEAIDLGRCSQPLLTMLS